MHMHDTAAGIRGICLSVRVCVSVCSLGCEHLITYLNCTCWVHQSFAGLPVLDHTVRSSFLKKLISHDLGSVKLVCSAAVLYL